MRNLDPAQLTPAQRTAMQRIRGQIGTPGAGTPCQRVIKLDELQAYLTNPDKRIESYFTKVDDVADLNTVDKLREGLRLDYPDNGYVGVNEVAIIEFDLPSGSGFHTPIENVSYPGTGNGFAGTRMGKVVPEYRFDLAGQGMPDGIQVPDGAKLYWMDPQGNKVLFGTRINGVWQ